MLSFGYSVFVFLFILTPENFLPADWPRVVGTTYVVSNTKYNIVVCTRNLETSRRRIKSRILSLGGLWWGFFEPPSSLNRVNFKSKYIFSTFANIEQARLSILCAASDFARPWSTIDNSLLVEKFSFRQGREGGAFVTWMPSNVTIPVLHTNDQFPIIITYCFKLSSWVNIMK